VGDLMLRIAVLIFVIITAGCVGQVQETTSKSAIQACIDLCQAELRKGTDLSAGPCLSNEVVPDWVCDVAHSPRQDVDNIPKNQCSAYLQKQAHHFVEVDENCNLIRAQ